jgi:pimeloyl-ACP methyl ester carboxylesterase
MSSLATSVPSAAGAPFDQTGAPVMRPATLRTFDGLDLSMQLHGPEDADLTVILVHCWTGDHRIWHRQVTDLLWEVGRRVQLVTYDHRGHGTSSSAGKEACTIDHLATDLAQLIEQVAPSGQLILAGHSLGGMTIMALAEQRPDILMRLAGTALVATSAGDLDEINLGLPGAAGKRVQDVLPYALAARSRTLTPAARRGSPIIETQVVRRLLFGTPARREDQALTVSTLLNTPGASLTSFFEDILRRHTRYDVLPSLAVAPVHVLVGENDKLTPRRHARRMVERINGSRLTIVPGAGHMLPLERDDLVSEAILELVRAAHAAPAATPLRLAIAR